MATLSRFSAVPRSSLALRVVQGKYKGGECPVHEHRDIVIGRSSEVDVVLVEEMVSRQHARIGFRADTLTIEDLRSTNGTFVNGERIKKPSPLRVGDLIHIGASVLMVVDETIPESSDGRNPDLSARGVSAQKLPTAETGPDEQPRMAGSLEEIAVEDLLQLFGSSRKTGVLVLRAQAKIGRIVLVEGRLRDAVIDGQVDKNPLKALCRMVGWRQGTFELETGGAVESTSNVELGIQEVLMEAFRQQDELATLLAVLPPMDAQLLLKSPLDAPLHALEPRNLEMLQLAINCPSLAALFDRSTLLDLDIARIVAQLLDRGYLIPKG